MNLSRTGTTVLVGAASGALRGQRPLVLGGNAISYPAMAEAFALATGALLQFMSPYTAPNVADGLVDGGAALLAKRGTEVLMNRVAPAPAAMLAGGGYAPWAMPSYDGRPQVGSIGKTPKRTLT